MFGYVKCAADELKIKQWRRYKAYYCGVCRAMGDFTALGRCVLSYDLAFYALLLDYDAHSSIRVRRCGVNAKKKPYAVSEAVDYAAAMNVLLSMGKLRDDIADGEGLMRIPAALLKRAFGKAGQRAENAAEICRDGLDRLRALEEAGCDSVDRCADEFAGMCAKLCSCAPFLQDGGMKRLLSAIGYSVARWVYIIDALDDLDDDIRHNRYNPIAQEIKSGRLNEHQVDEVITRSVYNSLYDALKAAQLLPESDNQPIILNIIQYGLADETLRVTEKRRKAHERSVQGSGT